jgi:ergothioneine biosynthesis protein EgtB
MSIVRPVSGFTAEQLIDQLSDARAQLRALGGGLPPDGWLGPRAEWLNPPLWEFGHIVWFQEYWCLRARSDGRFAPSLLDGADALYDSATVAHDSRWDLPLLEPAAVDAYEAQVTAAVSDHLRNAFSPALSYFAELCLYHERMHIEAWWMAFQHLGYAPPAPVRNLPELTRHATRLAFAARDVVLGSGTDSGFIFDNEKGRHSVFVPAFDIDADPVTETNFAAFVDAGGYARSTGWSMAGLAWRTANAAQHPLNWRQHQGAWRVRRFANEMPLNPRAPMLHVNRFEAEACAAWMGRRLPSAAEWLSATQHPDFQWGTAWEWMRDPFAPYPGFSVDPYQTYSQPWFDSHWELRGGGPFTEPLLKRAGFRNFYLPHRRDPFAGFRTVSLARQET